MSPHSTHFRISADALAYACESSGRCCKGWGVEADRETSLALPGRVAGIPRYDGRELLTEGDPASTLHYRQLAFENDQCVFLNEDRRCDLHARFGPAAKPLICRQYPHLAVTTPLGTDITLTYSCPSAAKRLLDPPPWRILTDAQTPAMAYAKEIPPHYPLQTAEGSPLDWEGLRTAGDLILGILAAGAGSPARELGLVRMGLEGLRRGLNAREAFGRKPAPLPVPSRPEVFRLASETLSALVARRRASSPRTGDAARLDLLAGFAERGWTGTGEAWQAAAPEAWTALRHYLWAKSFGNLLFFTYGLIPGTQVVWLLGLLVRLEAARRATGAGRGVAAGDVAAAAEVVDRLFPHESGLFDFWARKGEALLLTDPAVSAALILAGTPESLSPESPRNPFPIDPPRIPI